MTFLTTVSANSIDLRAIDVSLLNIEDLAYSLAHIYRFNGHALRQISVAEHSLIVCEIMERHFGVRSPSVLLAALLHDGHEHLTGDVTQPMKQLIGATWYAVENRIQAVVLKHFGVWTAFNSAYALIHQADMHGLSCEREQLMHPDCERWPCQDLYPALDWVRYGEASQFSPDDWRQAFIDRFNELMFALREQQASIPSTKQA